MDMGMVPILLGRVSLAIAVTILLAGFLLGKACSSEPAVAPSKTDSIKTTINLKS